MGKPKAGMTAKKKRGACLLAQGLKIPQVADRMGVDQSTVWRWTQEAEFVEYVLKESDRILALTVPVARARVAEQLDDSNGWLVQGASRIIMQEQREAAGDGAQQVVIHFSQDDTAPGMPVNDAETLDGPDDV